MECSVAPGTIYSITLYHRILWIPELYIGTVAICLVDTAPTHSIFKISRLIPPKNGDNPISSILFFEARFQIRLIKMKTVVLPSILRSAA